MSLCKVNNCRFNNGHLTKNHICGKCKNIGHGLLECGNQHKINNLAQFYNDTIPDNLTCKFAGCNSNDDHTQHGHQCFVCSNFGHPEYACNLHRNTYVIKPCSICKTNINYSEVKKLFGFTIDCPICLDKTNNAISFSCGHGMCSHCCDSYFFNNNDILVLPIQNSNLPVITELQNQMINVMNNINSATPIYTIYPVGMGCMCFLRRKTQDSVIECFYMDGDSWDLAANDRSKLAHFLHNYIPVNIN